MLKANNDPCLTCELAVCPGVCDKVRDTMGDIDTERSPHTVTWHGVTRSVADWADILGVSRQTLYRQLSGGADTDLIMSSTIRKNNDLNGLPPGSVEETYIRLSTLHLDYILYWNRLTPYDSSAGLVARYGAVQSAPTNATANPTEMRALPEASLSDEALYRRGWVACVLYIIERYKTRNHYTQPPNDRLKARLLHWRAIDGYTLKKMSQLLNEERTDGTKEITPMRIRKYMEPIILDLTREAVKRGLIRGTQK